MKNISQVIVLLLCVGLFSCNDGGSSQSIIVTDTLPPQGDLTGIPSKVTGSFKGLTSCKDCKSIEVLLKITDSSFWRLENYKEAKDKAHSLMIMTGSCRQESGTIALEGKDKSTEQYKIISRDTIQLVSATPVISKKGDHFILVRQSQPQK